MKHDESTDVRLLSRVCKINQGNKSITINRNQIIGNKRCGRLDFLCHYCGYRIVYNDGMIATVVNDTKKPDKKAKREEKASKRKQDKFARR